jgi:pimeloyl-ACP methyl ester carboxylesterase
MKFVKANGLVIHYLDQGRRDAPPLVFINSLGCDFRIWTEVAEILAPEFRVITYDKRGHGLSEFGPDKCEMADYAGDLMGLLDSVGVGRAAIAGLSIGGVIAQEFIASTPTASPRLSFATPRRKSEPTSPGISALPRSCAAASRRSPIPSLNAGLPPTSALRARPSSRASARCSPERRGRAISPLAAL